MNPPPGAAPKRKPEEDEPSAPAAVLAEIVPGPLPDPRSQLSPAEVRTIFLGLMLTTFLAALNQTIIATALPTIGRYFGDFESLSWTVTAYLLTSTAVAPLYGKLSDIYGRRAVVLACISIFVAGSLASALAPNMLMLIIGRGLQGIGGGGILPVGQAIIADTVTPRERGRYQAYMGIVWVTSGVGGPVLGGAIAEHLHWSGIFWLNVPLGIAAAWLTHTNLKRLPRHDRPHRLDLIGALLMMASAIPLLLALSWGGTRYPWLSPAILGLIASSFFLSFAFAYHLTQAPEPFLPLSVLSNPVMRMGTIGTSCAMAASIGLTIYVPLYYEVVHKLTAAQSGLAMIPIAVTTPGSLLSGRGMLYLKHYKIVPIIGLICGLLAIAVLIWKPDLSLPFVIPLLCIIATAIGTAYPICTVAIQNAVPHSEVGVAMGAMNFFRALVSAFAVALMGAIVLAGLGTSIERGGVTSNLAAQVARSGIDAAGVFRWVFVAGAVFLALCFLALVLMEERPLRGPTSADKAPSSPGVD